MPKDFRKKDFGRALRGYSVEEVDKYLDAVTGEYRRLEKRSWETAKQLADAEKRLDDYAAAEADAAETLDAADSILADAKRQADAFLSDARTAASKEAESILNEAGEAAAKTKEDALLLRRKAESLLREADAAREAADAARAKAWEEIAAERTEAVRQRKEAEALHAEAAEGARKTDERARRLEAAVSAFLADVQAFRSAAESMANAQLNAARNFTKDTERFLALLQQATDETGGQAENPEEADPANAPDGVSFPGIEQAVAAMRDLIVEIPDGEPDEPDEPEEPIAFEEPETFEEPEDPAFEDPDGDEEDAEEEEAEEEEEEEEPEKEKAPEGVGGRPRFGTADAADALEKSIRALLAAEPERDDRSALDLLDFEEPDSSRPPYKDVDFEALTASLRRDEPERPKDPEDSDGADDDE